MTETEREVRPVGRHEWEQVLGRLRVTGVLGGRTGKHGRATKGAVAAITFKAIAARFAFYGDGDGSRIWPGDAVVAVDLETTIDRVRMVRQALIKLGLLELVRGRRGDRGEEYRLTLPSDLMDLLEVLTPAQHKLAAHHMREARRGASSTSSGGPVDNPKSEPGWSSGQPEGENPGGPVDTPERDPRTSNGPPKEGSGWSSGHRLGGPVDTHTNQDQPHPLPTTLTTIFRTAVTGPRATAPLRKPDLAMVGEEIAPSAEPGSDRCVHGVPPSLRCPACARGLATVGARSSSPDGPDPPDHVELATVLTFRPRTA
jgi:hypothetical protein